MRNRKWQIMAVEKLRPGKAILTMERLAPRMQTSIAILCLNQTGLLYINANGLTVDTSPLSEVSQALSISHFG